MAAKKQPAPRPIQGVSVTGLSGRQIGSLRRHSPHHSKKHIRSMVTSMKNGATFSKAHVRAIKKVGT